MVVRLLMHPLVEDVLVFLSLALILLSAGLLGSLLWSLPGDDAPRSSLAAGTTASAAPAVTLVAAPAAASADDLVPACVKYSGFVVGASLADCKR